MIKSVEYREMKIVSTLYNDSSMARAHDHALCKRRQRRLVYLNMPLDSYFGECPAMPDDSCNRTLAPRLHSLRSRRCRIRMPWIRHKAILQGMPRLVYHRLTRQRSQQWVEQAASQHSMDWRWSPLRQLVNPSNLSLVRCCGRF